MLTIAAEKSSCTSTAQNSITKYWKRLVVRFTQAHCQFPTLSVAVHWAADCCGPKFADETAALHASDFFSGRHHFQDSTARASSGSKNNIYIYIYILNHFTVHVRGTPRTHTQHTQTHTHKRKQY
jgi:hypothetical protein